MADSKDPKRKPRQKGGQSRAGSGSGKGGQQRRRDGGRKGGGRSGRGGQAGRRGAPTGDEKVAQLGGPLRSVLGRLPETQRRVLEYRMGLVDGHPHNLADTARELGISLSEARDIEQRALEHIREVVPLDRLHKFLED